MVVHVQSFGQLIPITLLVAIPELSLDAFVVKTIVGLSNSTAVDDVGYICFCQSRCGNGAMYRWVFSILSRPSLKEDVQRIMLKMKMAHQCVLGLLAMGKQLSCKKL